MCDKVPLTAWEITKVCIKGTTGLHSEVAYCVGIKNAAFSMKFTFFFLSHFLNVSLSVLELTL